MQVRRIIIAAAVLAAAALALDWGVVQAVALGAALVATVLVPGYLVSVRLLPVGALDRFERLTVAIGLGFCVLVAVGLLINLTPLGVSAVGWVAAMALVIGIAMRRVRASGLTDAHIVSLAGAPREIRLNRSQVLALALAASVGLTAIGIARLSEQGLRDQPITQLWAVPENLGVGTWQVGVRNLENQPQRYRLVARRGDEETPVGTRTLADGETWTVDVPAASTEGEPLRIELYRDDAEAPYRIVSAGP